MCFPSIKKTFAKLYKELQLQQQEQQQQQFEVKQQLITVPTFSYLYLRSNGQDTKSFEIIINRKEETEQRNTSLKLSATVQTQDERTDGISSVQKRKINCELVKPVAANE